ncbi:cellulose biosynthesis cyclic di-GMP-binding regulatory protein BcsB [Bosea thiooxidans]
MSARLVQLAMMSAGLLPAVAAPLFCALAQEPPKPAAPVPPFSMGPPAAPRPSPVPAPPPRPAQPEPPKPTAPTAASSFKPLLPAARLSLEGENDRRSWAFYLTQDEAGADIDLNIAYQNALVVMPEASRLVVRVNNERVLETPIASSERPARLSTSMRKGLLRPGQNTISFEAIQRHRTDCSVSSTYELWTRIEGAGTGLVFKGATPSLRRLRNIDDLPAIGADETGRTILRIAAPSVSRSVAVNPIMAVAQALALRGRFSQPVIEVAERPGRAISPGTLSIVLATTSELPDLLGQVPEEAKGRSFLGFISDARLGPSTLLITGNSWQDIETISETSLTKAVQRPTNVARKVMDTATWHLPDAPFLSEERVLPFSELGVQTQESTGRRQRVRAVVAFPGDFYADAYGEATLYLDGAYSAEVRPGDSHIEVFVNGHVAATVPLNETGGRLFRHFPIKVPLRNFRAGVNEIWLEAVTIAGSDLTCGPGATLPGASRFALFDTSELSFPNFAKIGLRPNLAATAGTGFPYSIASRIALILGRHDAANYGAAATLLARLAQQASRPLAVDALTSPSTVADQPTLIIGAASQMPSGILPRVGVAETIRTGWAARSDEVVVGPDSEGAAVFDAVVKGFQTRQGRPAPTADPAPRGTDELRDRWRGSLGGPFARYFVSMDQWLQRTFSLSFAQLRIPSSAVTLYEPASGTDMIVAQAADPGSRQVLTAFVARREAALESTVARLTLPGNWAGLSGRLTAYQGSEGYQTQQPETASFVMTRPFSLANMRLVLANWVSHNIGAYALGLLVACIGLGIGTSLMLRRLGQRS